MKKAILLFALLLSAMNMMAQAYEFETTERSFVEGGRYFHNITKDYVNLNSSMPDIKIISWDTSDSEKSSPDFGGFNISRATTSLKPR